MRNLFSAESPLMNGLQKVFDCILLSLCWITGCLPIVTIGLSCGSMYRTVYRCIRRDEGYVMQTFWETYRKNWKVGILTWLPVMLVLLFLCVDAVLLRVYGASAVIYGIVLVLIAVAMVWAAYCTAYCVRFNGSVKEVLLINFFLILSHPLTTFFQLFVLVLGIALGMVVPYLMLFLPAALCLAISYPMETVFRKHMRPEDLETLENKEKNDL